MFQQETSVDHETATNLKQVIYIVCRRANVKTTKDELGTCGCRMTIDVDTGDRLFLSRACDAPLPTARVVGKRRRADWDRKQTDKRTRSIRVRGLVEIWAESTLTFDAVTLKTYYFVSQLQ